MREKCWQGQGIPYYSINLALTAVTCANKQDAFAESHGTGILDSFSIYLHLEPLN